MVPKKRRKVKFRRLPMYRHVVSKTAQNQVNVPEKAEGSALWAKRGQGDPWCPTFGRSAFWKRKKKLCLGLSGATITTRSTQNIKQTSAIFSCHGIS